MHTRPAEIGDEGVLLDATTFGSVGTLVLQVGEDEQAYLYGDWRMVADIAQAFGGERVAIVEGDGSAYGAHDILPLERV